MTNRHLKYRDLTLDQKIGLKGEFQTNPECGMYKVVMALWNFVAAIEFFLSDDPSILTAGIWGRER